MSSYAYSCSRALVVVLNGVLTSSAMTAGCRHLDSLAAEACTGRLALRRFQQMAAELLAAAQGSTLAERFLGMQAAAWADGLTAAAACEAAGCQPVSLLDRWPLPAAAAKDICSLLGER